MGQTPCHRSFMAAAGRASKVSNPRSMLSHRRRHQALLSVPYAGSLRNTCVGAQSAPVGRAAGPVPSGARAGAVAVPDQTSARPWSTGRPANVGDGEERVHTGPGAPEAGRHQPSQILSEAAAGSSRPATRVLGTGGGRPTARFGTVRVSFCPPCKVRPVSTLYQPVSLSRGPRTAVALPSPAGLAGALITFTMSSAGALCTPSLLERQMEKGAVHGGVAAVQTGRR